jgi:hypothetical protein
MLTRADALGSFPAISRFGSRSQVRILFDPTNVIDDSFGVTRCPLVQYLTEKERSESGSKVLLPSLSIEDKIKRDFFNEFFETSGYGYIFHVSN